MVLKTREKLIEVARQLFVNKGIENTTMNDIANASDKGRRTIYTYFKNKKEVIIDFSYYIIDNQVTRSLMLDYEVKKRRESLKK